MMTNKEILRIAIEQSAVDANCQPEDFIENGTGYCNIQEESGCTQISETAACVQPDFLWKQYCGIH